MTIKITDLVTRTATKIENQVSYINALKELKLINGLTHRQHEKINKILKENNLDTKYIFVFEKAEKHKRGKAYIENLEDNQKYFYANPETYSEIAITDETINEAFKNLETFKEAHNFALKKKEEIERNSKIIEDSKREIIEAMKCNEEISQEFHDKFLNKEKSCNLYVFAETSLSLSIY